MLRSDWKMIQARMPLSKSFFDSSENSDAVNEPPEDKPERNDNGGH